MKLFAVLVLFFGIASCQQQPSQINNISPVEFREMIASDNVILLDVRTPQEVADGYIKNAVFADYYTDDFNVVIEKLDKEKPVYVYCRSGSRSSRAAKVLAQKGFAKIYNLDGGILEWKANKYELIELKK